MEQWAPIPDFEGIYDVSTLGRVRRLDFPGRDGRRVRPRVLKPALNGRGYLFVTLWGPGRKRTALIHRLVLEAFVGPPFEGAHGAHWNGDSADNRLTNLRWATRSENEKDKVRHGTHRNAHKVHCPRGHKLEVPNLVELRLREGRRICLSCKRAGGRYRAKDHEFKGYADAVYARVMEVQ